MNVPVPPPRLHVLLARDAPVGLVIRRGPARLACTVGWDRRDDTFTLGQWLRGRIYEERCDLSPDGAHFLYFALSGKWQSETKGAYTALSRAPYLNALGLWPEGSTWGGGGLFVDAGTYWLANGTDGALREPPGLWAIARCPWANPFGTKLHVVLGTRLARDGWRPAARPGWPPSGPAPHVVAEKPAPGGWVLRAGWYTDRAPLGVVYALHQPSTGRRTDLPAWEWADVDDSRVVWTEAGRLCAASLGDGGLWGARVLRDFGPMRFEALAAPYEVDGQKADR